MPRSRVLIAVSATVTAAVLTACEGATAGQSAAQAACRAYANTGRHQVATTVEQGDAIRASALAQARSAAAADTRWQPLRRDIEDFYSRDLTQGTDEVTAYFAADRRVRADCTAAGQDIGPLRP